MTLRTLNLGNRVATCRILGSCRFLGIKSIDASGLCFCYFVGPLQLLPERRMAQILLFGAPADLVAAWTAPTTLGLDYLDI